MHRLEIGEVGNQNHNSDKTILQMKKEAENKDKLLWTSMWIIMLTSLLALVLGILCITYFVPEGILQNTLLIVVLIVFILPCFYALKLEVSVGLYKCKECGCEIIPKYSEALNAMHIGTTRYLKCPECKKRTWCKKVIKL